MVEVDDKLRPRHLQVAKRQLMACTMCAAFDPNVWGVDAQEFKFRQQCDYENSMPFIEPAEVLNDKWAHMGGQDHDSRQCPAKYLATEMVIAFIRGFKKINEETGEQLWSLPHPTKIKPKSSPDWWTFFTLVEKNKAVKESKSIFSNFF